MSATAAPFGLRPVKHPSGAVRTVRGTIASGYATNLYQYAPCALNGSDGTVVSAAAGARAIGSFQGVEYTDTEGRRRVSNRWIASTVATDIWAWYTDDPLIVYEVQANAAVSQANLGEQADWTTSTTGNSVTGLSTVSLDAGTLTNSGSAGLRIVDFAPYVDNAAGDAFPVLYVQISEHQNVADRVAY